MTQLPAPEQDLLPPGTVYRAYDIRGIAGRDLDPANMERLGKAMGSQALDAGHDTLLFGADGRLSSPELSASLLRGVLSTGCNIVNLGIIPTPLLYFAAHTSPWDSGLMLTASHNPPEYNGVKIVHERSCLTPEQIQDIRQRAESSDFAQGQGSMQYRDVRGDYIEHVRSDITLRRKLRVVVDCANAVPGLVAPELFEAIGCEVISLHCDLDGSFPHHHPDPTVAENVRELQERVIAHDADLGIALDGDGDRVVIVTNTGNVIDTDRLLMLLIRDIVPRYNNPNVVFDVKCSTLLADLIRECGGQPVMSRSGHSFMKKSMQESQAVVGAEFSAHVFIKDRWYGYDDGLYVAARFLELVSRGNESAEQMLQSLPRSIVTPELRIEVGDERKFQLMDRLMKLASFPQGTINILDGIRVDFADGWGLIRASNTTPALLLRFEARSRKSLRAIQAMFRDLLLQADGMLELDF